MTSALLSVVAGGLLALAYPPFPLGFVAYAAIAIALYAAGLGRSEAVSPLCAARRGWIFGTMFHLCTLYWTGWVAVPGMLTMVSILGLYVAAVFGATAWLRRVFGRRAIWLFPFLWVAHEYLRGLGTLAYPWTNLSLSQVKYPRLLQYAEATGDLGISFVVVLINVLILSASARLAGAHRRAVGYHVVGIVMLIVLPYLYGSGREAKLETVETVRVAVLQGDIDSDRKWTDDYVDHSFAVYESQTRAAARQGAELIVWPETAAPVYLRSDPRYTAALKRLSRELSVAILVGALEFERLPDERYLRYNAAFEFADGQRTRTTHRKLQLVPLGEMIPFADRLRFLDRLDVGGAHFTAGNEYVLFAHARGPYAAAICYESVFPDIIRRFALKGARFIVNITNDGWYGFTSGPVQHAAIATFRAIENRIPIARSANTGISGFIDRAGRFHEATDQYVPDVRIYDLPLGDADERTYFARHGMYFGQTCLGISLSALLAATLMSWLRRPRSEERNGHTAVARNGAA
jgi:apolipoprotein N-acyltransferase